MSLSLLVALVLAPAPGSVELERATWDALRATSPAALPVPAWAASRAVTVTPVAGGVQLRARWELRSLSPGAWFSGQVLGDMPGVRLEALRWDGQPAAAAVGAAGVTVAGVVTGRATLELLAFVPGDPLLAPLLLRLLPATRGRVEVEAPAGLVAALREQGAPAGAAAVLQPDGAFWSGAGALELTHLSPPAPASAAKAVVVARAGLGVTVGDAELRGRGRLVWELRRGSVEALSFRAEGVGAELEVTGLGVRAVQRSGSRVRVELQAPASGRVELDLRWSAAIGPAAEASVALPQIVFEDVFRGESALQLARDGEVEVVPEARGWTPVRAAALPGWAQGLVEGTPSAAFTASGAASGSLTLLRFVPLEGPPVVIDVAAYTIATSSEGRALIRAHYEVRNERAASLRIRPPPGFEILGVRVAGETAMIARDGEGGWRVPLRRSVDTVSGLLSFPVEVALLGAAKPWARRERRALPLPRLDAPVAVTRVTLHLPPGYRSRLRAGEGDVVASFTKGDGITYGLGVGEVGAAQADALFQGAVKGWLSNDFEGAQTQLDELKAMGASNENIARLQGNLDLISGRSAQQDAGVQRRIREQAKARAVDEQVALEQLQKQAEQSRAAGDYRAAKDQYQQAIAVGDRLAQLEQKESVEQQARNEALRGELDSTVQEAERAALSKKAGRRQPARELGKSGGLSFASRSKMRSGGASAGVTVYDFEDEHADGALDAPAAADKAVPMEGTAAPGTAAEDDGAEPVELEGRPSGDTLPETVDGPEDTAVDVSPTSSRDAAGVRLAGSTGAESRYVVGSAVTTSRDFSGARRRRQVRRISAMSPPAPPPRRGARVREARRDDPDQEAPREPTAGLPTPKVSASAVSVVVPTIGEAVLYQRLLLPADASHSVELSAREPWIFRR